MLFFISSILSIFLLVLSSLAVCRILNQEGVEIGVAVLACGLREGLDR